jgi:hypothetical protein
MQQVFELLDVYHIVSAIRGKRDTMMPDLVTVAFPDMEKVPDGNQKIGRI